MLVQRLRRWTSVKPAFIQRIVSAGLVDIPEENLMHTFQDCMWIGSMLNQSEFFLLYILCFYFYDAFFLLYTTFDDDFRR